jgi:hypothetical protein
MFSRRHAWLLILGAVLGTGGISYAQPQPLSAPDIAGFAGQWTLDLSKSAATEPERRVITVGPNAMRVELHRPGDDRPPVLIYNLDGSRNVNPFGSGTATTEIRREGQEIITLTVFTVNDRPVTVQERLRITGPADMSAAVIVRVEHGYQGVRPALEKGAPNASETLKHFRKAS